MTAARRRSARGPDPNNLLGLTPGVACGLCSGSAEAPRWGFVGLGAGGRGLVARCGVTRTNVLRLVVTRSHPADLGLEHCPRGAGLAAGRDRHRPRPRLHRHRLADVIGTRPGWTSIARTARSYRPASDGSAHQPAAGDHRGLALRQRWMVYALQCALHDAAGGQLVRDGGFGPPASPSCAARPDGDPAQECRRRLRGAHLARAHRARAAPEPRRRRPAQRPGGRAGSRRGRRPRRRRQLGRGRRSRLRPVFRSAGTARPPATP